MQDAECFVEKAEQCLCLVRAARDNADLLEGLANELMAKAVALESDRQRRRKALS